MFNTNNKKAFTLVELIVVIIIIAILGTIAFISLQGYSSSARDSRRISDISNIKSSLELFSINTGKYPVPDNIDTISYSGDTLWTQGTIGDNVTKNLSRNLQKKPTDPLFDIEYLYSVTNSQTEYELLALYEGDLVKSNLLNNTYAANYIPKISGTYNQIYVKSPNFSFPTPSIITSLAGDIDMKDNVNNIKSQVITGGSNIPGLSIPNLLSQTGQLNINLSVTGSVNSKSPDAEKISVINAIQGAYTGTALSNQLIYSNILSKISDEDKLDLAEQILKSGVVASTSALINIINNTNTGVCTFGSSTFGNCTFE